MKNLANFTQTITDGYTTKGDYILLGAALFDGVAQKEAQVKLIEIQSKFNSEASRVREANGQDSE